MGTVHNIDTLFETSTCRIVFVDNYTTASNLKTAIQTSHPQYTDSMGEKFRSFRKFGPFKVKNKTSLFNILKKTKTMKPQFEWDKARAVKALMDELEAMDLKPYSERRPAALSYLQRLRASMLCDMLDEHYEFILNDYDTETPKDPDKRIASKSPYRTIAHYARTSDNFLFEDCKLVWITTLTVEEMLTLLCAEEYNDKYYRFYTLQDGNAVELNKEELIKQFEAGKPVVEKPVADKPIAPPKEAAKEVKKATRTAQKAATTTTNKKELFEHIDWNEFREYNKKKFAENSEKTQLKIINTVATDTRHGELVLASLESGSVRFGDCYRSLRTGTKYGVIYPPVNITHFILNQALEEEGGDDMLEIFRELGYDIEQIRRYDKSEEYKKLLGESDPNTVISAGDYGLFTSVGLVVLEYEGEKFTGDALSNTFDIQSEDIWEKIT